MLKVIQIGVGPLGQNVVRCALQRGGVAIVGAVDPAPDKCGKDLGEICRVPPLGITVAPNLRAALGRKKADVAVVTTVSSLRKIEEQIKELARAGLNIVSTCEELSFPWYTQTEAALRIDRFCKKHGVACVGTGVNPGFLMDFLPCVLTAVSQKVEKVVVQRIQDASHRRIPFQQKIGAGLTRAQFNARVKEGTLRHVGLVESMHMIAHSLNWKLDRTAESLRPIIASRTITSGYVKIPRGHACGVEQIGRGYLGGKEVIHLYFRAAVGEKESLDTIEITGTPCIQSVVPGGVHGDSATTAITVNAMRAITRTTPGLKTMLDLPVPASFTAI